MIDRHQERFSTSDMLLLADMLLGEHKSRHKDIKLQNQFTLDEF